MRRGRKSPADLKRAINASFDLYGIPQFKSAVREYRPRKPSGERLEKHILADILKALRAHPKVARVERRQSGLFQDGNRIIRVGQRGEPDVSGMLQGGKVFKIEVKRPGEQPDERQQRHLDETVAAGGIAGCAHSVEEAIAIIER